ncbi:MAG: hypothetical protein Q7R81_07320 [Candidatus Peregrinibacteria bacterium]|nr:hypothetical protein [Candidatus Peregrinibacteria bacterium]
MKLRQLTLAVSLHTPAVSHAEPGEAYFHLLCAFLRHLTVAASCEVG